MFKQVVFGKGGFNMKNVGLLQKSSRALGKLKRKHASKDYVGSVCCEACWNAKEERCTCRCGGVYHGRGLKALDKKLTEFKGENVKQLNSSREGGE